MNTENLKPGGLLALVSLGPGDLQQMTPAARAALQSAEVVIGYSVYIVFVRPLLRPGQEIISSPIGREVERAGQAIELAAAGRRVALISSGDIGIYAMASPVFELLQQHNHPPEVQVYPGVSAIQATAARLGAPLGHDFCAISLSDLLTPWPVIERRVQAAAWGDFVIGFYNPRSQKRDWQLERAKEILLAHRRADTPVALARNITRPDEQVKLTTLAHLEPEQVDMFTLVLVGNSQSFVWQERLVTPRGYVDKSAEEQRSGGAGRQRREERDTFHVYPITLTQMARTRAVVIGGGPVGERKTAGLLAVGATVSLISPDATPRLQQWAAEGRIVWKRRLYQPGDLTGAGLVFAATNQRQVNAQVAIDARELGALCNVADNPAEGDFHLPAVHRQPGLVVAVSTSGKNPSQARRIRDRIAEWLAKGSKE